MGVAEQGGLRVVDAGYLLARHGVAANKAHPLRQTLGGLHDGSLDTAYVAHQAAGFEAFGVVLEKVHDALGVLAQDDHVRPRKLCRTVHGHPVGGAAYYRLVIGGLGAHRPHHLIVLKALKGHGQGAANQAQPHH